MTMFGKNVRKSESFDDLDMDFGVELAATQKNVSHFSCGAYTWKLIQCPAGTARAEDPATPTP